MGTSSVRAQHFEPSGEPHGKLRQEAYESADPDDVFAAVHRVLHGHVPDATSCFAHSLVAVDRDWNALTPILGWRDTRSAGAAEALTRKLDADRVHRRTGAFIHPSYWPAKLAWLAEDEPEIFGRTEWFVSFADYLRGAPETSLSMASSSGLLDLTTFDWDDELLTTLGIERDRLPQIADVPCGSTPRARTLARGARRATAPHSTSAPPVRSASCTSPSGRSRSPGSSSTWPTDDAWSRAEHSRTAATSMPGSSGRSPTPAGSLAERDPRDHGLVFLPFLGGERSTGWNPDARGTIQGLTFASTPLDIRQAAYEGVAFRFAAISDLLPDLREIVATGGGLLRDPDWIQIMADALARPVTVSAVAEGSLRGAALLALERQGHEVAEAPTAGVVEPRADRAEAYRAAREAHEKLYDALT